MKICVAILVKDRFYHTKLCCDWLLRESEEKHTFHFIAFDDYSIDPNVPLYLARRFQEVRHVVSREVFDLSCRIGDIRRQVVDHFLTNTDDDFLLLLDNDILVSLNTLECAIDDYLALRSVHKVGGLTLHGLGHYRTDADIVTEKGMFRPLTLTGDAHMLFHREDLLRIGNQFSAKVGGFADHQIKAIINEGSFYGTRIDPIYFVQHLGFGSSASIIYSKKGWIPFWNSRPYRHPIKDDVLKVPGFDMELYCQLVNSVGGLKAPQRYMEVKGL